MVWKDGNAQHISWAVSLPSMVGQAAETSIHWDRPVLRSTTHCTPTETAAFPVPAVLDSSGFFLSLAASQPGCPRAATTPAPHNNCLFPSGSQGLDSSIYMSPTGTDLTQGCRDLTSPPWLPSVG